VVAEALVLRAIVDVGARIGVGEQRLGAAAAIVLFFAALVLLELPLAALVQRIGRRSSARLRIAFLTRIPRLGDRYLASRPISDMAERCHRGHALRAAARRRRPPAARRLRARVHRRRPDLARPCGAPWIVLAALTVVVVPLALLPTLGERTLKVHSHVGALGRFYFDALLGLAAIRTHAAERSLLREHEAMLVEWSHAQRHLLRVQVVVVGLTAAVGLALAGGLFLAYVGRHAEPSGALLLLYWALSLPQIGERIADAAFELPALRVTAIRLLEPLSPPPRPTAPPPRPPARRRRRRRALAVEGRVVAGGHTILHDLDLEIPPASTSRSSARPAPASRACSPSCSAGTARPPARSPSTAARSTSHPRRPPPGHRLGRPRRAIVERHPAPQPPLRQRRGPPAPPRRDRARRPHHVLERLPDGLQSILGEGGGLVSGGEGQRVRLGRALLRDRPRLVLLDEPFRGLDRATREALLARVRAHWRGATLLCVTHDIDVAVDFDRVLVVDGGTIVEDNLTDDLSRETASKFTALLRSEAALRATGWNDPAWQRLRLDRRCPAGRRAEGTR
jgi:ABC-type sugar transport system ATPase subunit